MITQEEFTALAQLLQRTLMSAAEAQWAQVFLARQQAMITQEDRRRASVSRDDGEAEQQVQRGDNDSA